MEAMAGMAAMATKPPEERLMGRPEAVMRLMRLSERCGLDDVRACQVAVRCLVKRYFDTARHMGRRRDAEMYMAGGMFDEAARRLEELVDSGRDEFAAVANPPWEEAKQEAK